MRGEVGEWGGVGGCKDWYKGGGRGGGAEGCKGRCEDSGRCGLVNALGRGVAVAGLRTRQPCCSEGCTHIPHTHTHTHQGAAAPDAT